MRIYLSPANLNVSASGGMAVYVRSITESLENLGFSIANHPKDADVWHELDGFNVGENFFKSEISTPKRIITIHDLQEKNFPERFLPTELLKRENVFSQLAQHEDVVIIAISEFTKSEIKKYYPHLKNKIVVIPHGISHLSDGGEKWLSSRGNPIPEGRYGLVVAKGWSHKHLDALIVEILKHLDTLRKNGFGFVFVGNLQLSKETLDKLDAVKAQDVISITGFIDEGRKNLLLASAGVVVSSSDYEGFGLVAFEAKKYGKTFIGFDIPPLKEIFGDSFVRAIETNNLEKLVSATLEELLKQNASSPIERKWDDVAVDLIYEYWNSSLPKVSVITASYNRAPFIQRCFESLRSQTYTNYEHLIVDARSTDGSLQKISEFAEERQNLSSEPDEGIYDAFNKGVVRANGDLVAFLNTDDWYEPNFLRKSVAVHLSGNTAFTFGDIWFHQDDGFVRSIPGSPNYKKHLERNFIQFHHTTVVARRELFSDIGLFPRHIRFPQKTELRICADYLWFLRVIRAGNRGQYIPGLVGHMQWGGISTTLHGKAAREGLLCAINAHPTKAISAAFSWSARIVRLKVSTKNETPNSVWDAVYYLREKHPRIYFLLRKVAFKIHLIISR